MCRTVYLSVVAVLVSSHFKPNVLSSLELSWFMLTINQIKKKKKNTCLFAFFVEGMDHLTGPTAGNEAWMECCAPAESLRRGKTLNILTTETPGKLTYRIAQ